ncbi:hypothetical protein [Alsobacter metallidurans]|uniref:hypothetical protein n=1 Tax=Alsobacter metallidurans TaxID=340221 RepID=UPI00166DDA74|nr:hypothetical protein [Alsobacter metallidurans]
MKQYLSQKEASQYCGMSVSTFRKLGFKPSMRLGRFLRFGINDLERQIACMKSSTDAENPVLRLLRMAESRELARKRTDAGR